MNKYAALFSVSLKQAWAAKASLYGRLFFLFILIFIYNHLWEVIGAENNSLELNRTYIWYLLFAEMIILSSPRADRSLFNDIRDGTMAYYVGKPISFFLMRCVEALGSMTASFVLMGVLGSRATLLLTGEPPFLWRHFPIIFLMCYLSSCFNVLLTCAVGLCGLWLASIRTLSMLIERLVFTLGGGIFPLSIYPDWFIDIAKYTPFYSFYYLTIKLVYDFSWENLAVAVTLNSGWLCLIALFTIFAYGRLTKRINIYGG